MVGSDKAVKLVSTRHIRATSKSRQVRSGQVRSGRVTSYQCLDGDSREHLRVFEPAVSGGRGGCAPSAGSRGGQEVALRLEAAPGERAGRRRRVMVLRQAVLVAALAEPQATRAGR